MEAVLKFEACGKILKHQNLSPSCRSEMRKHVIFIRELNLSLKERTGKQKFKTGAKKQIPGTKEEVTH